MSDNNKANVHLRKPKIGGSIFVAPAGTTLPTDATTALDAAFKNAGYISEDGVTNNNSKSIEKIKAWGGAVVMTYSNEHCDSFKFTVIETTNTDTLKLVYGDDNVTATSSLISVAANGKDPDDLSIVIELVLRNGKAKRIVIPLCNVSEVGEITYDDTDAVGYETTVTALEDSAGNTHYEYIQLGA